MGLWGLHRGFDGVLMGFLGVPLVNGGWIGVLMGVWGLGDLEGSTG